MTYLGVRAGALNLLVAVGEVVEVVNPGAFTTVPLTLNWFRGLYNVRGSLYSIVDLPAMLGFAPVAGGAEARLLLLQGHRMRNTGVLVNRLNGMLPAQALTACADDDAAQAPPLPTLRHGDMARILGPLCRDGTQADWYPLDIEALVALPEFLDVAATPAQGAHA